MGAPPTWPGWACIPPRRDYRLIMRFEDYADDTAPYMYHCHLLLHEDEGLMGQNRPGPVVWNRGDGYLAGAVGETR
jgi:FtsP/CotA-like multicopper oxidase with cupredoxin domain